MNNVPNLDALSADELMKIWAEVHAHPVKMARRFFPERREGYVSATRALGNYAANKATANNLRITGKIQLAEAYENICDRIYCEIPSKFMLW